MYSFNCKLSIINWLDYSMLFWSRCGAQPEPGLPDLPGQAGGLPAAGRALGGPPPPQQEPGQAVFLYVRVRWLCICSWAVFCVSVFSSCLYLCCVSVSVYLCLVLVCICVVSVSV